MKKVNIIAWAARFDRSHNTTKKILLDSLCVLYREQDHISYFGKRCSTPIGLSGFNHHIQKYELKKLT